MCQGHKLLLGVFFLQSNKSCRQPWWRRKLQISGSSHTSHSCVRLIGMAVARFVCTLRREHRERGPFLSILFLERGDLSDDPFHAYVVRVVLLPRARRGASQVCFDATAAHHLTNFRSCSPCTTSSYELSLSLFFFSARFFALLYTRLLLPPRSLFCALPLPICFVVILSSLSQCTPLCL